MHLQAFLIQHNTLKNRCHTVITIYYFCVSNKNIPMSSKKGNLKKKTLNSKKTKNTEVRLESNIPAPIKFLTLDNLEVRNQSAYNEFLALSSNVWVSEKRYYRSKHDRALTIDLLLRKSDFGRAIAHLPDIEKRYINTLKYIVENAYLALTKAKNAATGQESWTTSFQRAHIDDMIIIENRKADIMALFGKMYSAEEVHKIINQDWHIDISMSAIENFRTRNLDKIVELQKDYSNNFNDVRLGYKKSRLEEYMWLYNETKQQYENTQNKEDRKFLKELLESIKREVEGDLIRIEGDLQVNIEQTLNIHIQQEIYKKLPINEIIVTRIALRTGINPLMLLYRLQNSYYAKYTGFAPQQATNDENSLPQYPSSHIYDLDKLNAMHQNRLLSEANKNEGFERYMQVSNENKTVAQSLKQIIAERIRQRQIDLEHGINVITDITHEDAKK